MSYILLNVRIFSFWKKIRLIKLCIIECVVYSIKDNANYRMIARDIEINKSSEKKENTLIFSPLI